MLENLPFGSDIMEVALALAFTYMIFSSIASGIYEVIAKLFKMRSKHLKDALRLMLEDPDKTKIVDELYKHRLIKSKLRDKMGEPTYIDATHFATALFDFLTKDNTGEILKTKAEVIAKINDNIGDGHLRTYLLKLVNEGGDKVVDIEARLMESMKKVETWFDSQMRDVSDWYKSKSRVILGIIAAVLTLLFNVDSVRMAKILWTDDEVRSATVKAAEGYYDNRIQDLNEKVNNPSNGEHDSTMVVLNDSLAAADSGVVNSNPTPHPGPASDDSLSSEEYFTQLNNALDTVETLINQSTMLPVGWPDEWNSIPCCSKKDAPAPSNGGSAAVKTEPTQSCAMWIVWKVIGLAITWGAIFLGGPYWFDLVKRLVTWRRTLAAPAGGGTASK